MKKIIVLGAGAAGLSVANKLCQLGVKDILVLERENTPGGLCRSETVDGSPLDIGGGHFLDVKRSQVLDFLFQFMGLDEWNLYTRDSRIDIYNTQINSPIEANIWQLPLEQQVELLKSIAVAGCNLGKDMPQKFVEWIYWKLGDKIAADYMIPYNQKMFDKNLDILGTYWLEKLPNVSFEDTLMSCLTKRAYGTQPGHAQFYYPKKFGYGEIWKRMGEQLDNKVIYNEKVETIDIDKKVINNKYESDIIINTIPWTEFKLISGMPNVIRNLLSELKYSSIEVKYFSDDIDTSAQWIYCPDPELSYHRKLIRKNFVPAGRGYWTETNGSRILEDDVSWKYFSQYAYPLNTINKPDAIKGILDWSAEHQVIGLGRWGEWSHFNSDVVVERALNLAEKLAAEI